MNPRTSASKRLSPAFGCFALLLPSLIVALGLFAVRPDWHAGLHVSAADTAHHEDGHSHPESDTGHGCAVSIYASGLLHLVAALPELGPSSVLVQSIGVANQILLSAFAPAGPPGRAPPSAS
jgi:hypothetical protein